MAYAMRGLGYLVYKANKSDPTIKQKICDRFKMSDAEYDRLCDGRLNLIYPDIVALSSVIDVPVRDLVTVSNDDNYAEMVHCNGHFSSQEDCDLILNLIDSYIDLKEAVDRYDRRSACN